jgi:hypothetical protein
MKMGHKLLALLLVMMLSMVAVTACGGATEPTETATPTPTETTPPTTEPTTEPEPVGPVVSAVLFGQEIDIPVDDSNAFKEAVEITSADGYFSVSFAAGTKLTDVDGNDVNELVIVANEAPEQPEDGSALVGATVAFKPDSTRIDPVFTLKYEYADFESQIAAVPDAEVYMARLIASSGKWGKFADAEIDTTAKTASVALDAFHTDYTVALVAATPKTYIEASGPPANGVDIEIESVTEIAADSPVTLTIKTNPGAQVLLWIVNPSTGTRSSQPMDRYREADENGLVTWEYNVSRHVSKGEGRFEFYVTTSTDADFLKAFQANRLDTIYPDKAKDLKDFMEGMYEQLEIDENTTIKMRLYQVVG